MRNNVASALTPFALACALLAPALGQTSAPQPAPTQTSPTQTTATQTQPAPAADPEDDVVRITSNLVQFDAVVYDEDGRQVTDLRPEEFEVMVGGKRQEITHFSYVSTAPAATAQPAPAPAAPPARSSGLSAPPLPPARLRPEQVRRTVALVVDDLGTSFESMHFVRRALRKFVDEQMQPGDLVAVIRTSAGVGALQQFTSDKRILHRAIERVRWQSYSRSGVSAFAPIEVDPLQRLREEAQGSAGGAAGGPQREGVGDAEQFREQMFTVGTLGALNFIVRGMDELPGRKSVVIFSDGFPIFLREGRSVRTTGVLDQLRRLTDLATRAAVSVYTVDARGLPTLSFTAADNLSDTNPSRLEEQLTGRREQYVNSQEGLRYLADQTGGTFFHSSNDLTRGIQRALEEQQGYYLIGFRPESEVFDREQGRPRYNRFAVKLKRAGLKVRTRGGFYGVTDDRARPAPRTAGAQLMAAVTSPFAAGDMGLNLTTIFTRGQKHDSLLESLLHIDVSRFTVADDKEDWKKLTFEVVAFTFGEEGQVVDSLGRTETVRMRGDALRYVMEHGLVYKMNVPLKRPGAYQLRVAVRDTATEKVGSATQFIEVPDLKKNRLALSSILLTSTPPEPSANANGANSASAGDASAGNASAGATPANAQAGGPDYDPVRDAAVRRFRQGASVDFVYHIYNAKLDKAAGRPQLRTQVRLFRDGQPVYEGQPFQYDPSGQADAARLRAGSRIFLGRDLVPGEYVLQVIVTDALADPKHAAATQWIDFEIVK